MPSEHELNRSRLAPRRLLMVGSAVVLAAAALGAGVYGMGWLGRNAGLANSCRPALEAARRIAPLARGEVAALNVATEARVVPDLAFRSMAEEAKVLSQWRGRTVLLNLWATWCLPCRKEMPALDALQAKLGGANFEVVAVNIDTRNLDRPKTWLKETGIQHLAYYSDPAAKTFQDLKAFGRAFGMPTTILIDPQGCEIAALAGPAEWGSEDAVKLVEAALKR